MKTYKHKWLEAKKQLNELTGQHDYVLRCFNELFGLISKQADCSLTYQRPTIGIRDRDGTIQYVADDRNKTTTIRVGNMSSTISG